MTEKDNIGRVVYSVRYVQYSGSVNFVVTHQVIFINVFSSVKNAQAYYVSPYCIVLSMPVEFLKNKKEKKRNNLLFHRVRTAAWSLTLWKRTPPRRSDILLLRSDDNIKHWLKEIPEQAASPQPCRPAPRGNTCVWLHWSSVSNHVTGCGHKWRSWNYLISLGKFWAPSSLQVQGLFFKWICLYKIPPASNHFCHVWMWGISISDDSVSCGMYVKTKLLHPP